MATKERQISKQNDESTVNFKKKKNEALIILSHVSYRNKNITKRIKVITVKLEYKGNWFLQLIYESVP